MNSKGHQETFETWNKVAALYDEIFGNLSMYNESYDSFCSLLPLNGSVLDAGCGPGIISKYLLSRRPDLNITGIDYAPNMIELAANNLPQAEFHVLDLRELSGLNKQFDAIVCGFAIPYLSPDEVGLFFKSAYLLLNRDGLLYLSFVEGKPEASGFMTGSTGDRTWFNYYQLSFIRKLLFQEGFQETHFLKIDYPASGGRVDVHSVLILRKVERG